MIGHLKLGTVGVRPEAPVLNDKRLEGVVKVVLTQRGDCLAEAVITLRTGVEFSGDVEAFFRSFGLDALIAEALLTDGAHHKQWFLELIAEALHIEVPAHEPGIAP